MIGSCHSVYEGIGKASDWLQNLGHTLFTVEKQSYLLISSGEGGCGLAQNTATLCKGEARVQRIAMACVQW